MTVGGILSSLESGKKMKEIAAEMGVSTSWIQRRLNGFGYKWDNSEKKWVFTGEGEEPREKELESHSGNTGVTRKYDRSNTTVTSECDDSNTVVTLESHSSNTGVIPESHLSNTPVIRSSHRSNTRVTPLTEAEILGLRELLSKWQNNQSVGLLSEAVRGLPESKKFRRTILAREKAFEEFDAFCDSLSGFEKGDLFSLALSEFVAKYSKE